MGSEFRTRATLGDIFLAKDAALDRIGAGYRDQYFIVTAWVPGYGIRGLMLTPDFCEDEQIIKAYNDNLARPGYVPPKVDYSKEFADFVEKDIVIMRRADDATIHWLELAYENLDDSEEDVEFDMDKEDDELDEEARQQMLRMGLPPQDAFNDDDDDDEDEHEQMRRDQRLNKPYPTKAHYDHYTASKPMGPDQKFIIKLLLVLLTPFVLLILAGIIATLKVGS